MESFFKCISIAHALKTPALFIHIYIYIYIYRLTKKNQRISHQRSILSDSHLVAIDSLRPPSYDFLLDALSPNSPPQPSLSLRDIENSLTIWCFRCVLWVLNACSINVSPRLSAKWKRSSSLRFVKRLLEFIIRTTERNINSPCRFVIRMRSHPFTFCDSSCAF